MQTVINEADSKCQRLYHFSLAHAYEADTAIISMICTIINNGWYLLVALASILVLGPIAFTCAVGAFMVSPVGAIIGGLMAVIGGLTAIRILYRNRSLPLAIKSIGDEYGDEFKSHVNHCRYIDNLIDQASDELLRRATRLL